MGQISILRVVVTIVICGGLLSVDDVTTLPLHPCSALVNHVDSEVAAARPLPADDLRLYLACLGLERQPVSEDEDAVGQLLALQTPNTATSSVAVRQPHTPRVSGDVLAAALRGRSSKADSSTSGEVCSTVQCLGRRAALTFEPCSRLTLTQCLALVDVLENIISTTPDTDDDDAAAHMLLDHFRQLVAYYRKWHQSHVTADQTRTRRHAAAATEKLIANKDDRQTGSESTDVKNDGMTSSRVISGAGGPRMRRSTLTRGIPFRLPEKITPETRAIIQSYLEWRAKNGYGRISGRWG